MTTLSRLASAEIVPAVINAVQARLTHPKYVRKISLFFLSLPLTRSYSLSLFRREMIRKKAIMCFLRFHQVLPTAVASLREELKKTLYDTDASVMGASLVLHQEMTRVS